MLGQRMILERFGKSLRLVKFTWSMLIAPWPPFAVFLAATAVLGALVPIVTVRVTTELIDSLGTRVIETGIGWDTLWADLYPLTPMLALFVGVRVLSDFIYGDSVQQYLAAQLTERVKIRFDEMFYRKASSLRLDRFDTTEYHNLQQRAMYSMSENKVAAVLPAVQQQVSAILGIITILWMLGTAHWAIPLVLGGGGIVLIRRQMKEAGKEINIRYEQTPLQRRLEYWRDLLTERRPAAEVRLFQLGGHIVQSWRRLSDEVLKEIGTARFRAVVGSIPTTLLNIMVFGTVVWFLIYTASKGNLTSGALVALLLISQQYMTRINGLGTGIKNVQSFFSELAYVPRFLETEGDERPDEGESPPVVLREGIRFESVSFTYPGNVESALSDIDLFIRPGERIALVGENGAGKTTLAKLLLGLYTPTSGRITVDGTDLCDIAPREWRRKVGAAFQDYVKYLFTVRENIGFGDIDKIDNIESIKKASLLSSSSGLLDELPNGLETKLGKEFAGGEELSQGQWQKLAMARVYMRDSDILVLDEPTSALDAIAEREVYQNFLTLSAGKLVLLISHRLGSARLVDRVVFLQQGNIIEEGTHDELVKRGGPYSELYRMQAEWYR